MDTGDPVQNDSQNQKQKVKKSKKGKKISLDEFLSTEGSNNWAVLSENPDDDYETNVKFDRSTLPSAPKAAMGPAVDMSQIPKDGPFSAYIGNLSYDANEEDLEKLFIKLEIDTVRIITDGGRPRGYAYVDFLTKDSLVEALSYNDREYMGRMIRVDLATDKNREGRGPGGLGGGGFSNEPDRTEGDWRRKDPSETSSSSFGPREDSDRSSRFGDRDRDRGYGFGGDRDRRGGGSFGDRDRGFGGDRDRGFGGDRDRGFGNRDRGFGDRDRGFGDRDRGFGGRDRGFGGDRGFDRGGDRDRDFGDRDRGGRFGGSRGGGVDDFSRDDFGTSSRPDNGFDRRSRDGSRDGERNEPDKERGDRDFGDRDRGSRYSAPRGSGYERRDDASDGRPTSRDGSQEHRAEPSKERPVLKLQPRSKPAENQPKGGQSKASSIFGSAKPVDTYAKEKEIEEKLKKKDVIRDEPRWRDDEPRRRDDEPRRRDDEPRRRDDEPRRRDDEPRRRDDEPRRRDDEPRRRDDEPRRRDDDSSKPRRYSDEGSEGKWRGGERIRPVLAVHKPPHVGQRDSQRKMSEESDDPRSPTSPEIQQPKMVPAPPPKENAWARKMSAPTSPTSPTGGQDVSFNASSGGPRKEERQKPPAAGKGEGPAKRPGDQKGDRRPGPRTNGDGSGGDHPAKSKPVRVKQLPKSIDEMPKYEESRAKDFSNVNKFSYLMEDDENDDDETETTTAASS